MRTKGEKLYNGVCFPKCVTLFVHFHCFTYNRILPFIPSNVNKREGKPIQNFPAHFIIKSSNTKIRSSTISYCVLSFVQYKSSTSEFFNILKCFIRYTNKGNPSSSIMHIRTWYCYWLEGGGGGKPHYKIHILMTILTKLLY